MDLSTLNKEQRQAVDNLQVAYEEQAPARLVR